MGVPGCHRSRRGRSWGVPTDRGHRNGNHTALRRHRIQDAIIVPAGVALGSAVALSASAATPAPYIGGLVAMFVAFYCLVPFAFGAGRRTRQEFGSIRGADQCGHPDRRVERAGVRRPNRRRGLRLDSTRRRSFVLLIAAIPMLLPPVRLARRAGCAHAGE